MAFGTFINERFDPLSHTLMITLFVLFHLATSGNIGMIGHQMTLMSLLFCFSFFFKLRLYDELKDYKTDLINNPTRPLPRGLLSLRDVRIAVAATFFIEFLLTIKLSSQVKFLTLALWSYSLLMYKEFFLSKFLENKLTTYALTHTLVVVILSLRTFATLTDNIFLLWPLSLACYFCFNVFEFGRKTFTKKEEKSVQTYSNIFGKTGAFFLSLSQIVLAISFSAFFIGDQGIIYFVSLIGVSLILMIPYLTTQEIWAGKLFRLISSFFVILFFITNIALTF